MTNIGVSHDEFILTSIITSILFNVVFAENNILSCFFFFLLIINLPFLLAAVIVQIFNPIAELVKPIGIPTNVAKAEIETHRVIAVAKIKKCLI